MHTFGAHVAEVRVDPDFGSVRVERVVTAVAGGRIVNPQTTRGQLIGGDILGIGMALLEEMALHPTLGKAISPNLSGYLVPVHADGLAERGEQVRRGTLSVCCASRPSRRQDG